MKLQNAIDIERYLKSVMAREFVSPTPPSHVATKTETPDPIETLPPVAAAPNAAGEHTPTPIRLKSILVPLDFSVPSLKSLRYAVPLAMQFGATITLVHVVSPADHVLDFSWPVPLEEKRLAELEKQVEHLREENIPGEILVNSVVRQGRTFDAILEAASDFQADLIIVATHGHTGFERALLGSTAENIVRRAKCPVLVVRESERDFR
jgi:universal stress protein A